MPGCIRQEAEHDVTRLVTGDIWEPLEIKGNKIVDIMKENGQDFSKSRASQILRMIESTNSPSRE